MHVAERLEQVTLPIKKFKRGKGMKELANGFAELAAIIMILITLAVSTAVISQWASEDASERPSQSLTISGR